MLQQLPRVALAIAVIAACGKKSDLSRKDGGGRLAVAPIALPALGVDRIGRFNFLAGDGDRDYQKASASAKKHEWAAARASCEAALAKDPQHLDAQWLLGKALAQGGEHAAAADHFETALAGDYYRYGRELAGDAELKDFLATPHGQAVTALGQQIRDEYARRIPAGLWLIGRRSPFRWPDKPGVQFATSRGELYAYDRETKRYFRLTHTDHQVVGFVRAPGGHEVAVIGFDKIDRAGDPAPPLIAHAWVEVEDTADWKPAGPRAQVPPARMISIGYATGDQLLIATAPATGRWTLGPSEVTSLDRTTGKLTKTGAALPVPRIDLTLDEARVVRAPDGIEAAWSAQAGPSGEPTTATIKVAGGAAIQVPESGLASESTVAVAPNATKVVFATAVDPCTKDTAPSLYVADGKSAALKHVLTARSRFATRWIEGGVLAYEDGDGAIRLWDPQTLREAIRLDERGGLALDALSPTGALLCKQAPQTNQLTGPAGDELPPEEGAGPGPGPVTSPQ